MAIKNIALYIDEGVVGSTVDVWNEMYHNKWFPSRSKLKMFKAKDFTADKLKDINCIILPGGSGSKICKTLGEEGRNAIKDFVQSGKSILGVCAGAYALLEGYEWSLGMIDYKIIDRNDVPKASKKMRIAITKDGAKYFQNRSIDFINIFYHNGPVMIPTENKNDLISEQEVLATFVEPIYESGNHVGQEINTPAIVKCKYGKGRVVAISPHFEKSHHENVPTWLMQIYLLDGK